MQRSEVIKINLPKKNSDEFFGYLLDRQSLIIIGANGSGKSHLAAFIEKKDYEQSEEKEKGNKCLRISAQRRLNFDEYIHLKSYEEAERKIILGNERAFDKQTNKWSDNIKGTPAWTTTMNDDYNEVLAAAISKMNEEYKGYYEDSVKGKDCEKKKNNLISDKIKSVFGKVITERIIDFRDASVLAKMPDSDDTYNANQMSDGERVCLYMICQVMAAPEDMLIIVDEPELHLHPSIMNRLWTTLEQYRPDCHFIYVTHDTDFAVQHQDAKIIWVKSFDGKTKWDYEELADNPLPDALLLKILGNRKNVLFIEGTERSWDYKIYSTLLSSFYVIPKESCRNVITATKTYRENPALHHLQVFGLIDRDYRTDNEIEELKKDNIYCLGVAEVENLFLDTDVLSYYHELQGISEDTSNKLISSIQKNVFQALGDNIEKQTRKAIEENIKYHLSILPLKLDSIDTESIKSYLKEKIDKDIDIIAEMTSKRFASLFEANHYESVLVNYNEKGLCHVLKDSANSFVKDYNRKEELTGKFYDGYRECIIRRLRIDGEMTLKNAFFKYIPQEIRDLNT